MRCRDEISTVAITETNSVQFKLMCGVLGFHRITTEEINKSFQVTGLFSVNLGFAGRFKTTHDSISMKYKTESFKPSTRQGGLIRPSDKYKAEEIRTLASKIMDHSRLIQKVSILVKKQNTINKILMGVQPVKSASASAHRRRALPSGSPAEHLIVGALLEKR